MIKMRYKQYEIRIACKGDIDRIMEFIKEEWSENHILATSRKFFEYEYLNKDGTVNFAIADNLETGNIDAVHAFYNYGNNSIGEDYLGGLWKAKRTEVPLLGVLVKRYLHDYTQYRSFAGVGSNPNTTIPIMQGFNWETGMLNHWYMLADCQSYQIAKITHKKIREVIEEDQYTLSQIHSSEQFSIQYNDEKNKAIMPYKCKEYLIKRYFEHPVYQYKVLAIQKEDNEIQSFLVGREIEVEGSKIFRIVDYIGVEEDLAHIGQALKKELIVNQYEYIDFYCTGILDGILVRCGFVKKEDNDENIIPNYFEPFVQKNVDIYYHIPRNINMRLCKADGDQDRPNFYKERN